MRRMRLGPAAALILAPLAVTIAGQAPAPGPAVAPAFAEDFDGPGGIASRWEGAGTIRAEWAPAAGGGGARPIPGVGGSALRVEAAAGASLATRLPAGATPARCERLVFRVDAASAAPGRPAVLEVEFRARGR